jgi:hypothetical protein
LLNLTPHHRPHFHAYYQNQAAVIGIDTVEVIGGNLSQREMRLCDW